MYWIVTVIFTLFLALLFLARREEALPDASAVSKPFYRVAMYLYKKAVLRFPKLVSSPQVEKDLFCLHPGESREWLKTEYYVRKIEICMAVVLVGTLFGAAAKISAQNSIILGEDGAIARGGFREGAKEVHITTKYGERQMDFQVEVKPVLLSEEEVQILFDRLLRVLPEYILGENGSVNSVYRDLRLTSKYGDFPVTVKWESGSPGIVSDTGQVYAVEAPEEVALRVTLKYDRYNTSEELRVTVIPPVFTEEERLYRELEELLERSQEGSLEQERWSLPTKWEGETIFWNQVAEDNSVLVWLAAMLTTVAIFVFLDRDMHGKVEKRKISLRKAYPEIVHKLALFVGAGMTIRGAFQKISGDYEVDRAGSGRQSSAYEEMLYTCRELRSGVSEGMAYEHFGRRTGLQEYIRLTTLLAQNLKKGNSALLERLREEADKAAEEQLQQSRRLGEEAGTKRLAPMVLMLGVVMAIIMIPAVANM